MTIVFLGGGRITSAMLAGLRLARSGDRFVIHDRNPRKMRGLQRLHAAVPEVNLQKAVEMADMLVVAVRPDSIKKLVEEIGGITQPLLAISVAAGIPLRLLSKWASPRIRWARAMPSPLCRSGKGLTA